MKWGLEGVGVRMRTIGVIVGKAGLEHEARVGEETFRRWNGKGWGWWRGRLLERNEACKFGERGIRDVGE